MQACVLIIFCLVFSLGDKAFGVSENEVKRGVYPFMAYIYYPDETVVDTRGMRFLRSAVLIRPEWLITSAIGLSIDDSQVNGFPRKTLLARAGTTIIDANFTLNEDEDEQEREVIQVVRPYNHSATQWWRTDISLMKTLLPFNFTTTVGVGTVSFKREHAEKTCIILVYTTKYGNWTEDKTLMQLSVELTPPSIKNCGPHFVENIMTCSFDSDENKNAIYDPKFCQGNSGGPLICDNKVIGLQTYIENKCKQPHLYQLLAAWENFITCSTEDKCQEEQCANICIVANKDATTTESTSIETSKLTYLTTARTILTSEIITTTTTLPEASVDESEIQVTPTLTSIVTTTTSTERSTTETETESPSTETMITTVTPANEERLDTKPWPNEKYKDGRKKLEQDDDDIERKINMEAQQQDVKVKKTRSAAQINMGIFQTLFFGFLVLTCLI